MITKIRSEYLLAILLLIVLCLSYSNHFDNGFYFDDTHTIVNNTYIRDITLLPDYYTDIKYYGTMPGNQGYNPVLVSLNAIDYWITDSLNPIVFHTSIFLGYVLLLVGLFFMIRRLYDSSLDIKAKWLNSAVILTVGFYALHASNAETINYIIMRSDSFSTLCIIASFLLYMYPPGRKYHLYLITALIGIGTKETGVMFGPLLLLYIFLFEEHLSFTDLFKKNKWSSILKSLLKSAPAMVVCFGSYFLIRAIFIPESHEIFANSEGGVKVFDYFITQWYVMAHYLANFILPLDLSADPDFVIISNILDQRILLSLLLILSLFGLALYASEKKSLRPAAFGILWFFIALAPTSTFHPLGQISNDHRTFFPYIGLVIAVGNLALIVWQKYLTSKTYQFTFLSVTGLILCLHAYGTYQRNEIWNSAETLWQDVTVKSPNNARGLMNYGVTQMTAGRYEDALSYFNRALAIEPYYSHLHINLGIIHNALGNVTEAESHFTRAIKYSPSNAEAYLYYSNWLIGQKNYEYAKDVLNKGLSISPGHVKINELLAKLNAMESEDPEANLKLLMENAKRNPTADNFINVGIEYYKLGDFEACVEACKKALNLNPDAADAYNNMCSAYINMGKAELAIEACNKAIQLRPDFELAKNNLKWAKTVQSEQK